MSRKIIVAVVVTLLLLGAVPYGLSPTKAVAAEELKAPVVTLDMVELAHYWGWWYYSSKVTPTKGKAGDYGAPLDLAFVFDIENPNPFPVLLESLKFTVAFEEFDLNSVGSTDTMWIPSGKTNQLRVHAMFDARQSLLSLLVTGGFKLKEKGKDAFTQLEEWWTGAPNFSFPVHVKEGAAVFKANGNMKVTAFSATFP